MGKSRRWTTFYLIGILGLVAVVNSITAEFKRTKEEDLRHDYGECILPGSAAFSLGVTAAVSLFLAQITTTIMGGCICCCTNNTHITGRNRLIAAIFLILSWLGFIFATFMLIAGSMLNQRQHGWLDHECYVVKPGVFGGAAVLTLSSIVFVIVYYGTVTRNWIQDELLISIKEVVPVASPVLQVSRTA